MQITIRDNGDLKAAARALRRNADAKELRKEFTKAIRDELRPAVGAVRAAYGGGKHLRPALAKATRMEVRTAGRHAGARIRVDGRRMFPRGGSLPAMYEGEKRWRHPVFGNRDIWVSQKGRPTFYPTVRPFTEQIRRRIDQTVREIANRIASG